MTLTEAIKNMQADPNQDNNKVFADFFRGMVDDNTQVYTTASPSGTGYAITTAEHVGNVYVVFFSDSSYVKQPEGTKLCTIGLSNLIDSCYANPHIMGIAVNPYDDHPIYIQRKDLQILSGKEDPRLQDRNWGKGIPEYTEADLMVAEEAIDFAMEIVAEYGIAKENLKVIESNNGLTAFPNFVCLDSEGKLIFIAVDVALAPNVPKLRDDVRDKIAEIAKEQGAKAYYAPVTFASEDSERMVRGLALTGDKFIGNFLGFIEIYEA